MQALNTLLLSQVADVVASEDWPTVKLAYRRCLVDPDPRVPALARKFHHRLLSSGSHFAMKEAFVNLAAAVTGWYQDKKVAPLLPSCGLSTECHVHTAALGTASLVLDMARELPRAWVRFPQRYVEEVLDSMVQLLSLRSAAAYSPLQLLAALDPGAVWLRDWLHGKLFRTMFLRRLTQPGTSSLLALLLERVASFVQETAAEQYLAVSREMRQYRDRQPFTLISNSVLEFGSFLHNVTFLSRVFSYRQGVTSAGDLEALLAPLAPLLLQPATALLPGRLLARTLAPVLTADTVKPILHQLLNTHNKDEDSLINALLLVSKLEILEVHFEILIPFVYEVQLELKRSILLQEHISKFVELTCKIPRAPFCPEWRHLVEFQFVNSFDFQGSAKLLLVSNLKFNWQCENNTYAIACRDTQISQQMLDHNILRDKINNVMNSRRVEDDNHLLFPNDIGDLEAEVALQEVMMTVSSYPVMRQFSREDQFRDLLDLSSGDQELTIARLRLLLGVCCSLDCLVTVEAEHGLAEVVLEAVSSCRPDTGEEFIIDEEYLYLRHLLSLAQELGGASEHRRQELSCTEAEAGGGGRRPGESKGRSAALAAFLEDGGRVVDLGWLHTAGGLLRDLVTTHSLTLEADTVRTILARFSEVNRGEGDLNTSSGHTEAAPGSRRLHSVGHSMVARYGARIGALPGDAVRRYVDMLCRYVDVDMLCRY